MSTLPNIFQQLRELDVKTALQRCQIVDVPEGVEVIHEGDEDPTCVIVKHGELSVFTGDVHLGSASAGDLLGEMALFTGGVRTASVKTMTPCRLMVLDKPNYEWLREVEHPFAAALEEHALHTLTDRLRVAGDGIAALSKGTAAEHVTPSASFFERVGSVFGAGRVLAAGRMDGASVLAKSPLFAGCTREVLASVAQHFRPFSASKGHFLCTEGETGNDMYLIDQGSVDVLVATGGDRMEHVATLEPGEAFGMCALLQPTQPRMASCVARESVTALTMDKLTWAGAASTGDATGSALRVAMIRALCDQLTYANAQLAMLEVAPPDDLGALLRAGGGIEAHGRYLGAQGVPEYLRGVK